MKLSKEELRLLNMWRRWRRLPEEKPTEEGENARAGQ